MKKAAIFILSIIFSVSCIGWRTSYVRVDDIISKKRTIAVVSFTFPKNMTNEYFDRLKYLNTQIYTDFVLNSFISNFNLQNEMIKLETLKDAIGDSEFSKLPYHYVLGADYVVASGTVATSRLKESTIDLLKGKVDGVMYINSSMSFWSQRIDISFRILDLNGHPIWLDNIKGISYHIIGDTGTPTRKTAYEVVIADVLEYQKRHSSELYIIIDEAISNGITILKGRVPYAFATNDILFTQKTFSLTNEDYSKKAGIH